MHKIAKNCIYNIQKYFVGGCGRKNERGRRENRGNSAMVVGGIDAPADVFSRYSL